MSRYFCHDYPETLTLETRVIDARPGAVVLEQSPFHPGGGGQLTDRGVLRWSGGETRVTAIEADGGASGTCWPSRQRSRAPFRRWSTATSAR